MAEDRAKEVLGGKEHKDGKKCKKRKCKKMHIRRAANQGYIAEHEYEPEEGKAEGMGPEEHIIPNDMEMLKNHVSQTFTDEEEPMV